MQAIRFWIHAILIDVAMMGLICFHMATGSEGALMAFKTNVWILTIVLLLFGLFGDKSWVKRQRPRGFRTYHVATEMLLVSLCAWNGLWVVAVVRFFADVLAEAARDRDPKEKRAA